MTLEELRENVSLPYKVEILEIDEDANEIADFKLKEDETAIDELLGAEVKGIEWDGNDSIIITVELD